MNWTKHDVITIDMGMSLSGGSLVGCDWGTNLWPETVAWESKASALGYDLSAYDHVEYWVPEEAQCTWGGMGELSNRRTWEREANCNWAGVRIHEVTLTPLPPPTCTPSRPSVPIPSLQSSPSYARAKPSRLSQASACLICTPGVAHGPAAWAQLRTPSCWHRQWHVAQHLL
eukprot:6997129-Prymnesium_polylepis.1